jgi:hypothetical protein
MDINTSQRTMSRLICYRLEKKISLLIKTHVQYWHFHRFRGEKLICFGSWPCDVYVNDVIWYYQVFFLFLKNPLDVSKNIHSDSILYTRKNLTNKIKTEHKSKVNIANKIEKSVLLNLANYIIKGKSYKSVFWHIDINKT